MSEQITVSALAKLTGRTPQYICRLIANGEIQSGSKTWKKRYVDKDQALGVLATKQKRQRQETTQPAAQESIEDLL